LEAHTNYPPAEGIPELREAVCAWYARTLGLQVDPSWVIVASGARPVMYATYRLFLEPGDTLVYPVPSWNNGYYAQLVGAQPREIITRSEEGFFPTAEQLEEHLPGAGMFALNSPLNPTGTVISERQLESLARVVVAENERRLAGGHRPLVWMWDQVYATLTYGGSRHVHPSALVPEVTPWVVTVDAISKSFAATGLRVGWAVLPPAWAERMKAFIGHVGAWAPRPEQVGSAQLLVDEAHAEAHGAAFRSALERRLAVLHEGLERLGVPHLVPQGAMYLSVCFAELFGKPGLKGAPMHRNEDVRAWLLERAGLALVPFQAFDLREETGWFRASVGAASPEMLQAAVGRLEWALAEARAAAVPHRSGCDG
jgi:aspartate aminotransferase